MKLINQIRENRELYPQFVAQQHAELAQVRASREVAAIQLSEGLKAQYESAAQGSGHIAVEAARVIRHQVYDQVTEDFPAVTAAGKDLL